jgi:hypothetical protein
MELVGQRNNDEPPSASDLRDMFPDALGWDWRSQEVIPSVWASVAEIEGNGWKIVREPPPPPIPSKPTSSPKLSVQGNATPSPEPSSSQSPTITSTAGSALPTES